MSPSALFTRHSPVDMRLAGVAGTGSVGSSWLTMLLAKGIRVLAFDADPAAADKARSFVTAAWPAMRALHAGLVVEPPFQLLEFKTAPSDFGAAEFIMEAVPERAEEKQEIFRALDAAAPPATLIASSTGGMKLSQLQLGCRHPQRMLVMHPLNPAHLVPLIEICSNEQTDPGAVRWAIDFCRWLGKVPVTLKKEVTGHVSNRLQAALLREAVHCLVEGIATPQDIDTVVTAGLGARWSVIGPLMTTHLAGGPGGTTAILAHAGDAMNRWWADLGTPTLTPEVRAAMIQAADILAGEVSIAQLVEQRDARLVELLKAVSRLG